MNSAALVHFPLLMSLSSSNSPTTPASPTSPSSPVPAKAAEAPKAEERKKLKLDDDDEDDSDVKMGHHGDDHKTDKKKDDDEDDVKAITMDDVVDADRSDEDEEPKAKPKKEGGKKDGSDDEGDAEKKMKMKQAMHARDADEARQKVSDGADGEDGAHEFKFAKHRKGIFNRVFRLGGAHDESTLLSFKKSLIKKALLKQNRDLDEAAVQAFKNVMSYMGDRKSSKKPSEHAKKMLRNLMVAPSGLRDEVYMQLCKQTTNNPKM
jgi:hypothetical protein